MSVGVTPSCLSHWLEDGKLTGAALIGRGHRARVNVEVALEQLRRNLDQTTLSAKARLDGADPKTGGSGGNGPRGPLCDNADEAAPNGAGEADDTQEAIRRARLRQLEMINAEAREEALARSGYYLRAEDARQQMGRVASKLMTLFEGSLGEMASAVAAAPPSTPREALRTLRDCWRDIRARNAEAIGAEGEAMPEFVEDA